MFERFTDGGRRLLVVTQEQARVLGHGVLLREHMLLALLDEASAHPESVHARIISGAAVPADQLNELAAASADRRNAQVVEEDPEAASRQSPPFSAAAKKTLELSLREALQLGHNYIAEFHMLLALIQSAERDPGSEWAALIKTAGLDLKRAREVARANAPAQKAARSRRTRLERAVSGERGTPGFEAVLRRATRRTRGKPATTGDLLLALLDVADTHASSILASATLPERAVIEAEVERLRDAEEPDGLAEPRVTVDKTSGTILINDPRITALLATPVEEETPEAHRLLSELIERAIAEARVQREDEPPR